MIKPLVIKAKGNEIKLQLEDVRPILWENEGLYALIPIEIVKNEVSIQQDKAKLSNTNYLYKFNWIQAIIIPPETGKVLAAQHNDETYKSTNSGNNKSNIEISMKSQMVI